MYFDKYSRTRFIICFCIVLSACANHKSELEGKQHILELSEIDFVSIARPKSISTFDESILKQESMQRVMQYSLSKGMIPVLISEMVEFPSAGVRGYVKQHIRLLSWADAQVKLKIVSQSNRNEAYIESDVYNNLDPVVIDPILTSSSDTLVVLVDNEDETLNKCTKIKEEHETQIGYAMGDFCKGHRLSVDYYSSLEELKCQTYPQLVKLAEAGIKQYCEPKID